MQARKQYGELVLSDGAPAEACAYIQALDTVNESIEALVSQPVLVDPVENIPALGSASDIPLGFLPVTIQTIL